MFVITLVLACTSNSSAESWKKNSIYGDTGYYSNGDTEPKNVTFAVSVENRGREPAAGLRITFLLPMEKTAFQRVRHLSFSPPNAPVKISKCDGQANLYCASYTPHQIRPFEKETIRFHIRLDMGHYPALTSIEAPEKYLSSGHFSESMNPLIEKTALSLKKKSAYKTAQAIFEFVREKIEFSGYKREVQGALKTLINGRGDCTDYAYLFTALCRASNIPARVLQGYVCPPGCSSLTPSNYHNWAEFYIRNAWHIADPIRGIFDQNSHDLIAIGICGKTEGKAEFQCKRLFTTGNRGNNDIVVRWLY